ncbi:13028_t:CDS:2, partial [Gigaspora margarita]
MTIQCDKEIINFKHISVLVDKKLYFSGGYNHDQDEILNDFFYLDVSQPFNIPALPWNDLTFTGAPTKFAASACSSENNSDLFIFGASGRDFISCAKFYNRSIAIFG